MRHSETYNDAGTVSRILIPGRPQTSHIPPALGEEEIVWPSQGQGQRASSSILPERKTVTGSVALSPVIRRDGWLWPGLVPGVVVLFSPAVWECGDSDQVCTPVYTTVHQCTVSLVVCTLRYSYTGFHLPPVQRSAMTPPPPPHHHTPGHNIICLIDRMVVASHCCSCCCCSLRLVRPESPDDLYILHWVSLPGSAGVRWSLASLAAATCISVSGLP